MWATTKRPGSEDFVRFTACEVPWYFEEAGDGGGYEGHLALVFNSFLQVFPVQYNVSMSKAVDYGRMGVNGTATGVIGDIVNNNADISLNPVGANEMLVDSADLTRSIGYDSWKIIGSELKGKSHFEGSFIFSTDVWIAIAVSAILFFCVVNVIRLIATKPFFGIQMQWTNDNILFHEISVLLLQGSSVDSHVLERMCWISWIFPSAFITWACCSSLLSTLTLPVTPRVHETFQDIIDDPKVQILILDNTPASLEMQGSLDPVVKGVLQRAMDNNLFVEYENLDMMDMFERVKSGEVTMLLPYDVLMEAINKFGICDAVKDARVPETTVFKTSYVYPIRKGTDTRIAEAFSFVVYALAESGIFTQSKAREVVKGAICVPKLEPEETIEELSMSKMAIAFWFLVVGVLISVLIIMWEAKIHRPMKVKRKLIKQDGILSNKRRRRSPIFNSFL